MIGRGRVVRPCRVLLGRLSVRVLRVQCLLCTLLCKRCADVSTTPAISEIGLRSAPECGRVEEEGHGTSCRNRQSRTYPGARSSRPFPPLPRRQTKRRSGPWLLVESAAVRRDPRENSSCWKTEGRSTTALRPCRCGPVSRAGTAISNGVVRKPSAGPATCAVCRLCTPPASDLTRYLCVCALTWSRVHTRTRTHTPRSPGAAYPTNRALHPDALPQHHASDARDGDDELTRLVASAQTHILSCR